MDNWITWAFGQQLGTGEKLVLVFLASRVGLDGVGRINRDHLAAATDYEPRSLQRILKTLRDQQLLHDGLAGGWFSLRDPVPGDDQLPQDLPPTVELARQAAPLLAEAELEAAGEKIAGAITEAADAHLVRMNDVSLRLLQGLERIAQAAHAWEQGVAAREAALEPPAPPPDPVRESVHFRAFMASGFMSEDEAYELAKKRLDAELEAAQTAGGGSHAASVRKQGPTTPTAGAGSATAPAATSRAYLDTTLGRFERIRDILDPGGAEPWADAMTVWQRLEDAENKHSVAGETPAFELLYPAIVTGARRWAGKMTLAKFLDERAIAENRAPWDIPETGGERTEAEIQLALAPLLEDLERANHKLCQAPERTREGSLLEPLGAYYLRVLRVHQQLKKLQDMGI